MEATLRAAVLLAGAKVFGGLIEGLGCGRGENPVKCCCGGSMQSKGIEEKTLLTIMGPVPYRRSRYECPACGEARYPGDEELDVIGTGRSPGVRRMLARAGSRQPFKEAREDLRIYAGFKVSAYVHLKVKRPISISGKDGDEEVEIESKALFSDITSGKQA